MPKQRVYTEYIPVLLTEEQAEKFRQTMQKVEGQHYNRSEVLRDLINRYIAEHQNGSQQT